MRHLTLALAIATLTACTSVPEQFREDPSLQGRTEAYTEGFYDGVRTGRHMTGRYWTLHTLDAQRYRTDDEYREGWEAGVRAAIEAAG